MWRASRQRRVDTSAAEASEVSEVSEVSEASEEDARMRRTAYQRSRRARFIDWREASEGRASEHEGRRESEDEDGEGCESVAGRLKLLFRQSTSEVRSQIADRPDARRLTICLECTCCTVRVTTSAHTRWDVCTIAHAHESMSCELTATVLGERGARIAVCMPASSKSARRKVTRAGCV